MPPSAVAFPAVDPSASSEAERLDIGAQQRAALGGTLDEQGKGGTARQRLESKGSGPGKQIQHPPAQGLPDDGAPEC